MSRVRSSTFVVIAIACPLFAGPEPAVLGEPIAKQRLPLDAPHERFAAGALDRALFQHRFRIGNALARADRLLGALVEERSSARRCLHVLEGSPHDCWVAPAARPRTASGPTAFLTPAALRR